MVGLSQDALFVCGGKAAALGLGYDFGVRAGLGIGAGFAVSGTPEDYQAMMLRSAVLRGANLPPEAQNLLDASSPSALSDALEQVGLKLESRKAPLDTIVIDSALKTPTPN